MQRSIDIHRAHRTAMILLVAGTAGMTASCKSQNVRAVVDVVPAQLSYSFEVRHDDRELGVALEEPARVHKVSHARDIPILHLARRVAPTIKSRVIAFSEEHRDLYRSLSRGLSGSFSGDLSGGLDRGASVPYRSDHSSLLLDLGVGEAPYDDGVPTLHGVELTRGGFSDALLQASWREPLVGSSMLHTTVSFTRMQDIGMIDGLEDMRFGWLVVGWIASF